MTADTNKFHFKFKGNRDYVQGGDIFDVLDGWFESQGRRVVGLSFRHFSSNQMACVFDDPKEETKAEGWTIDESGNRAPFWLVEIPEPVTERNPFDEEAITGHANITGDTIEADATEGYSVIEQVIALTKALNYTRAPDVNGKWVFGQLRLLDAMPKAVKHYQIRQKTLLAGRFSVQELVLDGRAMGEIRFITSAP